MKREKAKSLSANASKLSKAFGTNSQSNSVFHWQSSIRNNFVQHHQNLLVF